MPAEATLVEQLGEYVANSAIGDLPQAVLEKAKLCILDTLGCMLAGAGDEVGERITAYAVHHGPGGPCTVFGSAGSVHPEYAALANGTTAHTLEWDDGHRPSGNHIGCVVVPAALAMAQARGATGPELVLAVAVGYDVMGRVGEAVCLPRNATPFHGNGTTGVFGAAAACGKLLGLDARQLANALAIAGDGASGLREFPRPNGADCKPLHVGRAAQTGVTAAYLAAGGFRGPDTILEGAAGFCVAMTPEPRPELICIDLGTRFALMESGFKVHACVGTLALPVDAALWLRQTYDIDAGAIERIVVAFPRSQMDGFARRQRPPQNAGNARFSVSFVVAAALYTGEVTHRQVSRAGLANHDIAALEQKLEFAIDPEVDAIYAAQSRQERYFFIPCAVDVQVRGRRYRRLERTPLGYDPNGRGLDREQVVAKFRSACLGALSPAQMDRAIDWVSGLDAGSSISGLAEVFA